MSGSARTVNVEVADVRAEARDVMTLELRSLDGKQLPPFEPGAHLDVSLHNGLVRQYSLTNDWRERDRYVIGVGRAADSRGGSDYIHTSVRSGMQLKIDGPRNNFPLDPDASSFLFIAGGIGVTPIMAMVRWCIANSKQWRLIYAARSRQRTAFYEDLCAMGEGRVHFHFDDERGQILDVSEAISGWSEGQRIYCCGPPPLMEAVKTLTKDLPSGAVRFEWFTVPDSDESSGSGGTRDAGEAATLESFKVRLERSGTELAVPQSKSILEVLEDHGVDVPFSCREGLCGTCQTSVCEGEPDHRDYVLSDEERESGRTMMVCVSRSRSPLLVLDL